MTGVLIRLTPRLFAAAGPGAAARLGEGVRLAPAAAGPGPLIEITAGGAEVPVAAAEALETLGYVLGEPAVPPGADPAGVLDRWLGPRPVPEEALAEWLGHVHRAAFGAEPSLLDGVYVLVEPRYLRVLSAGVTPDGRFAPAREALFPELGLPPPPFELLRAGELRPGGFMFSVAGVMLAPRLGLPEGTVLVNGTPDELTRLNVAATATIHPETRRPASIVAAGHAEMLEAAGLTTWDPLGYLVACLAEALRANAHRLLTARSAGEIMHSLGNAWAALIRAADEFLAVDDLIAVLQDLLRDRVSILNMRLILELTLRCITEEVPREQWMSRIRAGLSRQITAGAQGGAATLAVHLIDPGLEEAAGTPEGAAELRRALDRVRPGPRPVVLTRESCREAVREALHRRFPDVTVLSDNDLTTDAGLTVSGQLSAGG
ncbi:FHIPEP family type III secretion protein [Actinoplanes sp. NPDC000266]